MEYTGAAGVMIGRAAQGKPWLPGMIARALTDQPLNPPALSEQCVIIRRHLSALHDFYGDFLGVRIARKHIGWFVDGLNQDPTIHSQLANMAHLDDLEIGVQSIRNRSRASFCV